MSVTFTTNIGLAKPTEAELASNWAVGTQLQEDNNAIIEDKTNIPITSYTPVITAQTTPPNLGAGSAASSLGNYQLCRGWVWGNFKMVVTGAGIAVGSGEYGISLPFPVDGTFHSVGTALNGTVGSFSCIGDGYIYDSSAIATSGAIALDVVTVAGVSYVRLITEQHAGKTSRAFRDSMPFAIAANDQFTGQFFYKKA